MKKIITMIVTACISCFTAFAEYRLWTDKDGATVEAELVRISGDDVVLKKKDQRIVKIKIESLSKDDKIFATLNSPPKIKIEVSIDTDRTNESRGNDRSGGIQVQNETILCTVTLKKQGSNRFDAPLQAHLLLIGKLPKKDYYVVMKRIDQAFTFREENEFSFSSDEFSIKQFQGNFSESSTGIEYEGYIVTITDPSGEIIEQKANRPLFEKQIDKLKDAKRGMVYDDDFNLVDDGTKAKEVRKQTKPKRSPPI